MDFGAGSSSEKDKRGPTACRYDDSLQHLTIQLVVNGIREKSLFKGSNTNVHLKSDANSLSCTIDIVDVDKKKKPPVTTVVDSRFYEVRKFPGEIGDVNWKLKKNCCVLTVDKKIPASWENQISQNGPDMYELKYS